MRSRDGNRTQSRTTLLLILIASVLEADEYIISYYSATKNAQLLNEKITVSRAMTPCSGQEISHITLPASPQHDLPAIILENRDDFLSFIRQYNLHVKSFASHEGISYRETTTLSMPPRCFTVIFNDNFAKISALN